jgi:hypothetical protein
VSGADAQLVEVALERVGASRDRELALERRPAVVARERGCYDLEARDELREHRAPVAPGAHEAVQQDEGLPLPGAVERV